MCVCALYTATSKKNQGFTRSAKFQLRLYPCICINYSLKELTHYIYKIYNRYFAYINHEFYCRKSFSGFLFVICPVNIYNSYTHIYFCSGARTCMYSPYACVSLLSDVWISLGKDRELERVDFGVRW